MTGTRVRQTRELLGLTQIELAERTGLQQSRISSIESGQAASPDDLAAFSRATGFPVEWFDQEPYEEFPDGTIRYRKRSRAPKRDDRQAVRRLEVAAELVEKLSAAARPLPVTLPFVGDMLDVEHAAEATRDALDLPPQGPVRNLVRAVERAGAVVVPLPVDMGAPSSRLQYHHGVSAWPDPDQRPVIGFSTDDPGDRQRHTVAHEVGHLVMHRGPALPGRDYEREASHFAGALLMPRYDAIAAFLGELTLRHLARLKQMWGISIAGLVMRARQVDAITDDRVESFFKQLSTRGWRKEEPVIVKREEPALLPRLLEANFGKSIDWIRAGGALRVPPLVLRQLAAAGERDVASTGVNPHVPDLTARRRSQR